MHEDVKRQILRDQREVFREFRQHHGDMFTGLDPVAFPESFSVFFTGDAILFQQTLRRAAAEALQSAREESIDPLSALLGNDGQNFFFHE